ncbi:branched-chain amino acid ABC transporter permease [Natronomonas sp. F2-12]|jgi:branched-chain amino acid transport system permease protein|uniref:Branched-chain amino acid ABC transporter permease n=1 Tax=Natronomonas aquatica TaxID=2841590 RepID=A0A9R1D721_9EURY|nr:branched-chain amino acid ABC transporter permease [Natronomonas aquatica]MCQ4332710.1 branched-chain amino acid ABC transporter permease [Natronomonas aquatica]
MSVGQRLWRAVPSSIKEDDKRLIIALLAGTYLLYAVSQVYLALMNNADVFPAVANSLQNLTFLIAVYAIMALALNLHWGYTGLFNIGIAGFMAVGVYSMSILAAPPGGSPPGFGLPVPIALIGALVITAIVGGIAALPALQLEADYLAIVTVGLSEIIRLVLNADYFSGTVTDPQSNSYNVVNLFGFKFGTGGGQGINTPTSSPASYLYGPSGDPNAIGELAYGIGVSLGVNNSVVNGFTYGMFLLLFVVTAYYVLLVRIGNSPFGRVLKAIREDELVAQSLGKDTRWVKIKVFMVGCALMGLGGILWQGSFGFVNPNTFRPIVTFYIFTALIVGGSGSNTGSVVGGAVFAAFLFEGPRQLARVVEAAMGGLLITVSGPGASLPSPNNFYVAFSTLDPLGWLGYTIGNISSLRFILLGVVLVYMMQNRSEGLLGHRKEIAASVDLSERKGNVAPTDGGETNE